MRRLLWNAIAGCWLILVIMVVAVPARADAGVADEITAAALGQVYSPGVDRHWHHGEYNRIVGLCKIVAAADPGHVNAFSDAGWLLWSMNKDSEAVKLYEDGLKVNPKSYYMYHELGHYYANRKKDWKKALPYLEGAAKCSDNTFFSMHLLAHAYEKTGQAPKALAVWKKAAADPKNGAARHNLTRLEAKLRAAAPK